MYSARALRGVLLLVPVFEQRVQFEASPTRRRRGVSAHTSVNTSCAFFTSLSVIAHAASSSLRPFSKKVFMSASKRPVLSRPEMMIGFEVRAGGPLRAVQLE